MEENIDKRVAVEALVTVVLFSFISVLIKMVSAGPVPIAIVRLSIAVSLMYGWLKFRGQPILVHLDQLKPLLLIGVVFSGHWLLFFMSIKVSTPSIAVLGLSSYGVYLLILGRIFQKTRPTVIQLFSVILAALGNVMLVPEFSLQNNTTKGLLLGLGSGFMLALLPILHQKNREIPDSVRAFWQFIVGLVFFSCLAPGAEWNLNGKDWIILLILSVFCTFGAHTLWVRVSSRLSITVCSLIYYATIPLAMLISFLVLGEEMTLNKLTGAALILLANITGLLLPGFLRKIKVSKQMA